MSKYLWLSLKMQFRVPISIFFSLAFPLLMMVIMLLSYGNFSIGNGYRFIDKYFLISTGIGLVPIFMISYPIWIAESMQNHSYRRLYYFGVDVKKMIWSDILSYLLLTLISVTLNILAARVLFQLHLPAPGYVLSYFVQVLYCALTMLLVGTLLALIVRNTKVILPIGMICLFMIYMLCGVFINFDQLPSGIRRVGNWLPVKYLMNDFFSIWSEKKYLVTAFIGINTWSICIVSVLLFVAYQILRRGKNI